MKAVFAGSFDPFTIGHHEIVERAVRLFDKVVVAIGHNEHKPGEWTVEQRLEAISALYAGVGSVEVMAYNGLTAEFVKEIGADVIVRGVRNIADFEYERNLADTNSAIAGVETVFLACSPQFAFVSSSMVRELIHHGHDASRWIAGAFPVPPPDRYKMPRE